MRWIRQHIGPATWLAFTALAVHLVMTFGHVHAEWFSTPSHATTAIGAAGLHEPDADGAGAPTQPYRAPVADNFCAICANVSLLGTLVLPVAQRLAPPRVIVRINEPSLTDTVTAGELRSSSQARAPPSA
jgi:hypothetical protein